MDSRFADIGDQLESGVNAIFFNLALLESLLVSLARESQNVTAILAGNSNKLATLRPVNLLGLNFNTAHQVTSSPVEEGNTTLSSDTQQDTASEAIGLESNIEAASLFGKVLENLDTHGRFADGEIVAVLLGAPYEVESGSKGLVSPGKRSIDDVLAITADSDESTVGGVNQSLRVNFAGSEILGG